MGLIDQIPGQPRKFQSRAVVIPSGQQWNTDLEHCEAEPRIVNIRRILIDISMPKYSIFTATKLSKIPFAENILIRFKKINKATLGPNDARIITI